MADSDPVLRNEEECLDARLAELLCQMRDRHLALQAAGAEVLPDLTAAYADDRLHERAVRARGARGSGS